MTPTGLPLGVISARFDAPPSKSERKPEPRKTERWLEGVRNCAEVARELTDSQLICVMDREGDAYEIFAEQRTRPEVDLLVRAKGNRRLVPQRIAGKKPSQPPKSLLKTLQTAPVLARMVVAIDRLTPRPKRSKRPARPGRQKRQASLVLRSQIVELTSTTRQSQNPTPIRLTGILVEEECPPENEPPIQWLLLTTLAVATAEDCRRVVHYYAQRWRIEDWHRIIKSGCKIEELANRSAARIERAVAINLVIAWCLYLMTLLGRDHPNLPQTFSSPNSNLRC